MAIKVLVTVFAFFYAAYLAFVIFDQKRRKRVLNKYKKGSMEYAFYSRIYTRKFLAAWIVVFLASVSSVLLDLYRHSFKPSGVFLSLGFIATMMIGGVGLYLLFKAFRKM